MRTPI